MNLKKMKNNNFSLNDGVVKKQFFLLKISALSRCKLKKLYKLS